jgi:hypothetical protein
MPKDRVIRSSRPVGDRILRNLPMTGVATASSAGGPMLINELWSATTDTTNRWTVTLGATGNTVYAIGDGSTLGLANLKLACPAASDTVILASKLKVPVMTSLTPSNTIYKRSIMEWEAKFVGTIGNTDNAYFFMGLTEGSNASATRATNRLIGFSLASDALNTITDDSSGTAENTMTSPPTMTNRNKFKMVFRDGGVDFYVNDVFKNTHTTNILTSSGLISIALKAEAGTGAINLFLGPMRFYALDE